MMKWLQTMPFTACNAMIRLNKLNITLFYWLILVGCNHTEYLDFSPPIFPDTTHLEGKIVVDNFIMGASFDIDLYNNTLFVVAYTGEEEEALHLFNKNDGNHIKSILPKGRGPGEALTVSHIDIDRKNGNVYFYDYVANKMHHFSSDSVIHHVELKKFMHSCRYPIYMYRVLKADSRLIAVKGLTEANGKHPRLSIINKDTIISKYYDFPPVRMQEKNGIEATYNYSEYSICAEKNKIVCTCFYGGILEIFDIGKDEIKLNCIKGLFRPVYNLYEKTVPIRTSRTVFGFADVYATPADIFTIFCGSNDHKATNKIAAFDWNGECKHLYITDYRLSKLCIDEKSKTIYSTATTSEYEKVIVKFNFP